jgi:AcrR family transcriptional regulator
MAELAEDCEMSPGNIYRYFPGKLDIAEEICRNASIQNAAALSDILTKPDCTAAQRLRDFLFQDLRETFHTLEQDPKIVEMAHIVATERPTFFNEGLSREREVLQRIIEFGNVSGEFQVADPAFIAEVIQSSTMKFMYPQLFTSLSLEALERELEGVYAMISAALKAGIPLADPGVRAAESVAEEA